MCKLLQKNPTKRANVEQVLAVTWQICNTNETYKRSSIARYAVELSHETSNDSHDMSVASEGNFKKHSKYMSRRVG